MLDLVEEIESYSPQTGQAKAASPYNNDAENYINKSVEDSKEEKMETNEKRAEEEDRSCTRFLKQKYYEEYFNVSEIEVLTRVKSAIIPPFKQDFLEMIAPNPDLYGPLWISATIVVLLGTIGNFSRYIYSKFSSDQVWDGYFFELELVRYGFIMVYSLAIGVPVLLYFVFRCLGNPLSLPQLICTYGYANMCFVFGIILCIIPVGFLQGIFLFYAFVNSSLFLIVSLRKHLNEERSKQIPIFGVIIGIQLTYFLFSWLFFMSLKPKQRI